MTTIAPDKLLQIDFLFLDLETCTRCRGADRNLEQALERARGVLAASGTETVLNKVHITSPEQARDWRFVSSPTIRVNGRDVALELRESSCGSEACTDGCGDSIACRVWVHGGEEHTEPPVAMLLEAIRAEAADGRATDPRPDPAADYVLPENLARFFAGRGAEPGGATHAPAACCEPAEQLTCCTAERKPTCCGTGDGETCGCR
jgi:hypothetical protein